MDQDDTEILERALMVQAKNGRLVLRRKVWINGVGYDPAVYVLQHAGPAPESNADT